MAAWLQQNTRTSPREFIGVHVLEERMRRLMLVESIVQAEVLGNEEVRRIVAASGAPDLLAEISTRWSTSAEEGLALAAAAPDVAGIIIGRAAASDARGLVRLGRVARRLLRSLPAPVMVVPPDLSIEDVGRGPIVLATDLDPASAAAAVVARDLAKALDRELLVVSVDAVLHETAARAPLSLLWQEMLPRRTTADLRQWMGANELAGAELEIVEGERVSMLISVARHRDAPVIVCGSRGLSLPQRVFASSTATALARTGERAVLVVPNGA